MTGEAVVHSPYRGESACGGRKVRNRADDTRTCGGQLKDYAAGTRDRTVMRQFGKRLSSPELARLAAH